MARYVRGETARISGSFTVDGVPTTPTATTIVVTRPDGTVVAPAPSVVVDSVGNVHADVVTDQSGLWHWRMVGTGAAAGVFEGSFSVLETPMDDLLRVAQFRAAKPAVALDDDTLQMYIDAATSEIIARYGRIAPIVERRHGGTPHVWLSRQATAIGGVVESWADPIGLGNITLDPTDYTLMPDGYALRREYLGTHKADYWGEVVTVTYTPFDTTADRQRVVIALVKLDLNHNPGLVGETIGDYSRRFADNSAMSYAVEREEILNSLAVTGAPFA